MSVRALVARAQRAAQALMLDTCVITRAGEPVTVGGTVTVPTVTVYEGKCKLQTHRPTASNPDAVDHSWSLLPLELHLPVAGTGDVRANDLVEITDSADPANVGRRLRIRGGDRKTFQSAFRPMVEEVAG
jgi:hypothetical protein